MIKLNHTSYKTILMVFILSFIIGGWVSLLSAKDTDIYQVNTKQNCIILVDSSGSMDWGVYEAGVDYGAMYDYLFSLKDSPVGDWDDYIYDYVAVNPQVTLYQNPLMRGEVYRNKIFLVKGTDIGLTLTTVDEKTVSFTGDPGNTGNTWDIADIVDTNTLIDSDGKISYDGSGTQRITTDGDGHVLLDGVVLPLDRNIKLKEMVTLYGGSQVDKGFGGLLNAPGHYFSGYEGVTPGSLDVAEHGDDAIYFFVTGNWVNMQAVFNLTYTTNNPDPAGASTGDEAWRYETIPLTESSGWSEVNTGARYPETGNYTGNLAETTTQQLITHPGATQIQVHFSAFDVEGDSNNSAWTYDYVAVYDGAGNLVAKYDNDNKPTSTNNGWSVTVNDDTVKIALKSDPYVEGTGYIIDKIRTSYQSGTGSYLMQTRIDIAKDALLYVIDEFHGKMNWGFASYKDGDGATINADVNPNDTDDANRQAIINAVSKTTANGGTPMGEALQDVFQKGYHTGPDLSKQLSCRKNYVISLTDGFPSADTEWDRITDITSDPHLPFEDWDGDGWTADPSQYATPDENYYDDVGHWMYTHSYLDKTEVADPANSYVNVITHHISFGMDHPLLEDAAGESGGLYISAYNKAQLVAAFYALTLQMTEAVSFTSPVVSVDSANKIQNGDDLYLGLFLPQDAQSWMGNIKKFLLGDGSAARPDIWMIYDGKDKPAIDNTGTFLDNTAAFWADDNDSNDSDNYGSADVKEDGVGEILTERVAADLISTDYWERPIYTYEPANTPNMKKVHSDYITKEELNVADDATRNKLINYLYGYTNDAAADAGHAPIAVRDWALGSIVHSRPVVIDYYDPNDISILSKRYIAVGANDGMLHIFDDATGEEIFAFVPKDLLPKLKMLPENPFVDMVDGEITLYRSDKQPKYLIFGERAGGSAYWCLNISETDPLDWSVQWVFTNPEIAQSWSAPIVSTIPVSIDATTGKRTFKDILIFTGGYDPEEDNYPEPFNDVDNTGSPLSNNGQIDPGEWKKTNAGQDPNANGDYDFFNSDINESGRGIFAIDINDASNIVFSVSYDATTDTSSDIQTLSSMKFCFPASPSIISGSYSYVYQKADKTLAQEIKSNVLNAIYATDIYSNVYKINYQFKVDEDTDTDTETFGPFSTTKKNWEVTHVFSGNSSTETKKRKTFYPPVVSWGGSCNYFDSGNYQFLDTNFLGTYDIASLYFGTGDREHPTYTMIQNRFFAIYDDSSVTAVDSTDDTKTFVVSTVPYTESDLLNLTCNELDTGSPLTDTEKYDLKEELRDDATYTTSVPDLALENGTKENDAKGWFIIFENQGEGKCSAGYTEDHKGEKVLSKPDLYAGILYFTTYQPAVVDPCTPQGNGFTYALNYCDATSAYNLNSANDSGGNYTFDISDRSNKVSNIFGIPSDFAIVTRKGQAGAMSMMGGKIVGPQGGNTFKIKSPGMGLELYYWRESNSQK